MEDTQGTITLEGIPRKLVDRSALGEPPLAQIHIPGAGELYDEIRIPNAHLWPPGKKLEIAIRPRN